LVLVLLLRVTILNHDDAVVQDRVVKYSPPGPTVKRFGNSKAFVRGIKGPIGSGKSVGCVIEILRRAQMQAKGPDGIRRTRWAVVRNSYPELKSTTMKTWSEWAPGKISGAPPYTYLLETDELHLEVIFLALDHPDDARKVLSLEVTGVWLNEAREIPKTIVDGLSGRVGRYPSKNMGGCTWSGIIMDTNPPDSESWWYKLAETEKPEGWDFFEQPAGDSPEAENIENLPPGYYERIKAGKDPEWIKVYVKGEYGFVIEGNPVYPMFRDSFHTATENVIPDHRLSLQIGIDFGLTPAAIIGQRLVNGGWLIVDELVSDNSGIIRFAETLTAYMYDNYSGYDISGCFGDPAGNTRGADERTSFDIMNAHSPWKWKMAADTNEIPMRLEVVKAALNRAIDGKPGFILSPKCAMLRKGFSGGYHYKLLRSGDGTQSHSEPNKNQYSHPHDALQYLLLGAGEANVVLNKEKRSQNRQRFAKGMDYKVFK
jgi:hypothetical protein